MIPWIRKYCQPRSILGAAVVALSLYGIRRTALATWVVAHGGDPSFDGAFNYPSGRSFISFPRWPSR